MTSAHFQNGCFQYLMSRKAVIVPVRIPPYTPRPVYGGRMIDARLSLYSCHWSMT